MTGAPELQLAPAPTEDDYVLPEHITEGRDSRGPRFADDVWEFRAFVARTSLQSRIDFTTLADDIARHTVKEYLYSRIRRGTYADHGTSRAKPLKITNAYSEFNLIRVILRTFRGLGAERLTDVTQEQLRVALVEWKSISLHSAANNVAALKHLYSHSLFLSEDRLTVAPWPGRGAKMAVGLAYSQENTTLRIPEEIIAPLLKAAVFYVEIAGQDILAAKAELRQLEVSRSGGPTARLEVRAALEAFVNRRRVTGQGIPSIPPGSARMIGAPIVDGIAQAPNVALISLLVNANRTQYHNDMLIKAGAELGYEIGGLDTPRAIWPETGRPWRPGFDPSSIAIEITHLRTACWIVIAYLSGMRDTEVRELGRDCAFTEPGEDGRIRYKLRGKVFKGRELTGEEAEWVVLKIVHRAVAILREINDDATHLFGYNRGGSTRYVLLRSMFERLGNFRDHVNELFSAPGSPFIPFDTTTRSETVPGRDHDAESPEDAAAKPWHLTTVQFRRTLAWHIAHQPFGVVAGARQYQHAQIAIFEGYAGTSASGFAAEVASEQAIAKLDYLEDLYRDWNDGMRSGGGAAQRVDAEFERVRRELGDIPGVVASPARLRTMLAHLAKVLHPGTLNDCFHNPATALCAKRAKDLGRPLPLLDMCTVCPNSRRSQVHLPRLVAARDQAQRELFPLAEEKKGKEPLAPLQRLALTGYVARFDRLIEELTPGEAAGNAC